MGELREGTVRWQQGSTTMKSGHKPRAGQGCREPEGRVPPRGC